MSDSVQIIAPGRLEVGMQMPITAQSTYFAAPWEAAAGSAEIIEVAQACDRAGFFYLAVCDHVAVPRAAAGAMSTIWYDCIATLGFLAAATQRVRLLSYVYVPAYRHPLQTAKAFATLDALSNGRVILGVGAGHLQDEFAMLGLEFGERGKRLDEAIDLIKAAFLDEYPEHTGTFWQVRDMGQRPRPLQQPRPPIWVGGSTLAALKRAARRGDGWLPQGVPEMGMEKAIAFLAEERARAGHTVPLEIGMTTPWIYLGEPSFDVGPHAWTGHADAITEALRARRSLGVHHLGVRFRSRSCDELVEQIERFGAEVLPHLNDETTPRSPHAAAR